MKIHFQSICDIGAVRPNNEDAIRFGQSEDSSLVWMIVADGMGGHLAGEVASNILVSEIELAIENLSSFEEIDWLCWVEIELNRANNKIFSASQKNSDQKGMGTTAVLVIIYNHKAYIGWVGDSRCYLFSDQQDQQKPLTQITVDHTMVQALLEKGAITESEAEASNNKNMLSKALGIKKGVEVDSKLVTLKNQDILFLSTDGLHDHIPNSKLGFFIGQLKKKKNVERMMVEHAIQNGSKDNITFGTIFINSLK